jgi:hypothetical protein
VQDPAPALSSMNQEVERPERNLETIHLIHLTDFIPYEPDPSNFHYIDPARKQGALIGYAGQTRESDFSTLLALGLLDYWCQHAQPCYYQALNAGFTLALADGSRTPVYNRMYGNVRTYVQVEGDFTYEAIMEAVRAGRTFRTNGAVGFLKVNDRGLGETVKVGKDADEVYVEVEAMDGRALSLVELLCNGKVVKKFTLDRRQSMFRFADTVELKESSWFGLRVNRGNMQTSPIYVIRGKEPIKVRADVDALLETVHNFERAADRLLSRKDRSRIGKAKAVYHQLLRR